MLLTTAALIPEAREDYLGASLAERTGRIPNFVDLGPADLCNIHKLSPTSKSSKELGTYLYYTGVDTLNSASIAAHLQGLANLLTSKPQYWFNEKKVWKVPELTYCTYNAFSKVDMRVTVHIPGKFESQVINSDGKLILDKLSPDELEGLWLETYVLGIVRLVLDPDDEELYKMRGLVEIRRVNPLNNGLGSTDMVTAFIAGFEKLFWDGSKLGCSVDIPLATLINNYLVDGFLRVIELTQQYDTALEVLERLQQQEPAVVTLYAKVLLMKDEEVRAVQVMLDGIKQNDRDLDLLLLQTEFCIDKNRTDLALSLAKQAVKLSPLDFKTWGMLVKVYTMVGDFENALLTLNSCPMSSHKEKFTLRRVVPLRGNPDELHLPLPVDVTLDGVLSLQLDEVEAEERGLDPLILNLPAANLKLTFAKAYDLLTEIVNKTGWETLLKYRAKVFVMEEEYRKDKLRNGHAKSRSTVSISAPTEDGELPTDDAALTLAVKLPKREANDGDDDEFRKKRLCERWLDNLFMLLYEDLRTYTMWQAESVHFQAKQMDYKKTSLEWDQLGQIAYRLKHFKEGLVAFSNALTLRFLPKAQMEMLKYYQLESVKLTQRNSLAAAGLLVNYAKVNNTLSENILQLVVKLMVWNHRWYSEFSPTLIEALGKLIAKEGLIKIKSLVQALYSETAASSTSPDHVPNRGICELMDDAFNFYRQFNIAGSDN